MTRLTPHYVLYTEPKLRSGGGGPLNRDQTAHPLRHLPDGRRGGDPGVRCHRRLDPQILGHVRVRQKMSLQVTPLVEAPGANRTLVRRLLHVQDLVYGQSPALAESFSTFAAFKWLLFAVDVPRRLILIYLCSLV